MKKIMPIIVALATVITGLITVDAKSVEVNLKDIQTNTFIVGERIYELNEFRLSIYDVVSAAREYAETHKNAQAPIYYYTVNGDNKVIDTYVGGIDEVTGRPVTTRKNANDVLKDGKFMATYKNNVPLYTDEMLKADYDKIKDAEIAPVINNLDKKAGFESIKYNADNNTVTFDIKKADELVTGYATEIANAFASFMGTNATKATYNVNGTEVTVDLKDENLDLITEAAKILTALTGKGLDEAGSLTLKDLANKKVSADITFDVDGTETTITYNVDFKLDEAKLTADYDKIKDAEITSVINNLDKKVGFESIEYNTENNTVTFEIKKPNEYLTAYASEIASAFGSFMGTNAKAAKYIINGTEVNVDLTDENLDLISEAAKLLTALTGKDLSTASSLTLKDVANKNVSADITFVVNGIEITITYNVDFKLDETKLTTAFEKTKDSEITTAINKIPTKAGFESITYNADNNTVTFDIKKADELVASYANEIANAFASFMGTNAIKATYNVNGTEVTVDLKDENLDLIAEAAKILTALTGKDLSAAGSLTLKDLANKKVSADITFDVDGIETTITYNVDFKLDVAALTAKYDTTKDAVIANSVSTLNPGEGFSSINYNSTSNTVTFEIQKDDVQLTSYTSQILTVFQNFAGSELKSASYTVNNKKVDVTLDANSDLVVEAAKLLSALSGKEFENITDATVLTLGDVAGKSVTATLTFEVNGIDMTIDYTVAFVA